jgi:hypothetical protein
MDWVRARQQRFLVDRSRVHSGSALGPNQLPVHWVPKALCRCVKQLKGQADDSPLSPFGFVTVEWLGLLFSHSGIPYSNSNPETGCPDWGFSWFSSVIPGKCRDSSKIYAVTDSFHINSIPVYHLTLLYCELLIASLNKPQIVHLQPWYLSCH